MKKCNKLSVVFNITGFLFFVIFTGIGSTEPLFLQYHDHLIPIKTDPICKKLGSINGKTFERVVYIDDVGVRDEDPNGVQDLVVVMALAKKRFADWGIDLRGVGTTSTKEGSNQVIHDIVDDNWQGLKVRERVLWDDHHNIIPDLHPLRDFIIEEALAMKNVCGNHKLIVASGAPLVVLDEAIKRRPEIKDYIKVIALQAWNRWSTTKRDNAYKAVIKAVGPSNMRSIPDKPDSLWAKYEPGSKWDYNFRIPYKARETYSASDDSASHYSAPQLDWIYETYIRPLLNKQSDKNRKYGKGWYYTEAKRLNSLQGEGFHHLRIADFLAIYELIKYDNNPWGHTDNQYSQYRILNNYVIPALRDL